MNGKHQGFKAKTLSEQRFPLIETGLKARYDRSNAKKSTVGSLSDSKPVGCKNSEFLGLPHRMPSACLAIFCSIFR
jgi:hypothetical protein